MKKAMAILIAIAFVVSVAGTVFGRTYEEEAQAVRDYLNVVDAKLATAKQAKNTKRIALLHAEKSATLARWNKLKLQMATQAPAPVVVQVVTPPPPVVVTPAPAKPVALLGLGVDAALTGTYLNTGHGKIGGVVGVRADYVFDVVGAGNLEGLASGATLQGKIGSGFFYGADNGNRLIQTFPLFVDGVLNLPHMAGGMDAYVGGGLNYTLYGTGQTSGPYGIQAYVGMKADFGGNIGMTNFELGYSVIRTGGAKVIRSAKGITISVGQSLYL